MSYALPAHALYPEFVRTQAHQVSTTAFTQRVMVGDFNGDGRPDVVTGTALKLLLTLPNGTFAAPVDLTPVPSTAFGGVAVLDGNEDGRADLIVGDTGGRLLLLPGRTDGTFDPAIVSTLAFQPLLGSAVRTGDFNGDGHGDVILGHSDLTVLLRGDGAGHFAETWRREDAATYLAAVGDLDGDGRSDLVFPSRETSDYQLFYGKADGTFDGPATLVRTLSPGSVVVGDLDGDGDGEIIAGSNVGTNAIHVNVNTGSRTFAGPSIYPTGATSYAGDVYQLAVVEVSGDAYPDVVATLQRSYAIATYVGNGNGTLRAGAFEKTTSVENPGSPFIPRTFARGDFNGDGRVDLAVAGGSYLGLYRNSSGELLNQLTLLTPTISVGQTATVEVQLHTAGNPIYGSPDLFVKGPVTIRENSTVLASGTPQSNRLTLDLANLSVGNHGLTASTVADESFLASTSSTVTQRVLAERTTTTLTANKLAVGYGGDLRLNAEVSSPLPEPINGTLTLRRNGQSAGISWGQPTAHWEPYDLAVGNHEFQASFSGTSAQPPSESNIVRVTVSKGPTRVKVSSSRIARENWQPTVWVEVTPQDSLATRTGINAGTVRLYAGSELLVTHPLSSGSSFTIPSLPQGMYFLRVAYSGTENWEASQSEPFQYTVVPDSGLAIQASPEMVNGAMTIRVRAVSPFGDRATHFLYQRVNDGPWTVVNGLSLFGSEVTISNPIAGAIYLFRIDARDFITNQLLGSSNVDAAMVFSFTDHPLQAGASVKAVHVQQLLQAINALRTIGNLNPISLTGVVAGQPIRATHLAQLRTALNEARLVQGMSWITFSDGGAVGTRVQAKHFQEMRDAMQ